MKVRVLIGLIIVSALSVYLVSAQDSAPATASCSASGQKTAAAAACCSGTAAAQLTSVDGQAAAGCSGATAAKLASVDGKATACCSGATPAKLASATPGCPMEAAGIQLTQLQQTKIQGILAPARKDLLAVLNVEQQAKFAKFAKVSQVSLAPLVFGQQASITSNAAGTQSCSAQTVAAQTVALTAAQTTASCSDAAPAKLTSLTGEATACCSGSTPAKLASLTGQEAASCSGAATVKLTSVDEKAAACCSDAAAAKLASTTPGCPMQAAGIQLTSLQQVKIQAILAKARKDMLAVLSSDQQAKFAKFANMSQVSLMPLVLGQKASLASSATASTQACCAAQTVAQTVAQTTTTCPADCQKPCCASETKTVAEQTTCPIMGSPIKKAVFTVYQGKKVYFCCPGCDKAFTKNPEKYTKNLPQFGQ